MLENGNGKASSLWMAHMKGTGYSGETRVIFAQRIKKNLWEIEIENGNILFENPVYGNLIFPGEILRVYDVINDSDSLFYDLKILKVEKIPLSQNLKILCIARPEYKPENLIFPARAITGLNLQKSKMFPEPSDLYVKNITKNSAEILFEDNTLFKEAIAFQIKYKKANGPWIFSDPGGWIFSVRIENGGSGYKIPETIKNGKRAFWLEFSLPDLPGGKKPEAWAVAEKGTLTEIIFEKPGSGYLFVPSVKLYDKNPALHEIKNPYVLFDKSTNIIRIISPGHSFSENENIEINFVHIPHLNGIYKIISATVNEFTVQTPDNKLPFSGNFKCLCTVRPAPVPEPKRPGILIPVLDRTKYLINNLETNTKYYASVMAFYSKDLKKFSEFTTPIVFKTF